MDADVIAGDRVLTVTLPRYPAGEKEKKGMDNEQNIMYVIQAYVIRLCTSGACRGRHIQAMPRLCASAQLVKVVSIHSHLTLHAHVCYLRLSVTKLVARPLYILEGFFCPHNFQGE